MKTSRTEDGRLFPSETFPNGWRISAQADAAGYACAPKQRLDALEDYDSVEVVIYGPENWPVDPRRLGLPDAIAENFTRLEHGTPALGLFVTPFELEAIRDAVRAAEMNPNAGVPRGTFVWSGRSVFHGGSRLDVDDILANGIDMGQSSGGYFGQAFYVADDARTAHENYAEAADDEGAVVRIAIAEDAKILDLRNAADWETWKTSGLPEHIGRPDFAARARKAGIAGVYDRSMAGLAIYDPRILTPVEIAPAPGAAPKPF